ncbi:Ig-like domain-containing protein [candidate division KSB1 bacterium]|nr:Ig-like domain-containing protein [candidate division KSB1 bacterium]NIR71595.1 Ig-like domain-containing protein [candidate division KSB1 bacterium]NIS23549.1 Ig-like domain-containing protein [candidate division KSB1 bacterium]NIT70472.1 Ig-like domain-containing protein [candidate division KSB1 bacterium]NIU24183.1 Ig-like domain-containing protein [candidate division KSB1 bacterium]
MTGKNLPLFYIFIIMTVIASCKSGPVGPPGRSEIEELRDPFIVPKIVWSSPLSGSVGPYPFTAQNGFREHRFILQFNKLMDMKSVAEAITFGPNAGAGISLFYVESIDQTKIKGTLKGVYLIGQEYFIVVDSTGKDLNGNHLVEPDTVHFLPEPYFRITVPNRLSERKNVEPAICCIDLVFNNKADTSSLNRSVHIDPPLDSGGLWFNELDEFGDGFLARTYTAPGLIPDTTYRIVVTTGVQDTSGHNLKENYAFEFITEPFKLVVWSPQINGAKNVKRVNFKLGFKFNSRFYSHSILKGWKTSPAITGVFDWGITWFTFTASDTLRAQTTYSIALGPEMTEVHGRPLANPITLTFTTGDSL